MILDAINGIEENISLRYELQDRYEYILVDEFQDTNDAQMKLLNQITKYDEEDRKPNIMAVGDDDQAIYKFQGAELSNILNFTDTYPDTKIIAMSGGSKISTEYYRASASDLGTHRIFNKPFALSDILNAVKELIEE